MCLDIGYSNGDDTEAGNNYSPTSGVEFLFVTHIGTQLHEVVLHGDG